MISRQQAIVIKKNAEALIRKYDTQEKDEVKKIANKYEDVASKLNGIIMAINQNDPSERILAALKVLKVDMGNALRGVSVDMNPVVTSIKSLESTIKAQKPPEVGVVQSLERLGKLISSDSKPKETEDRTDELLDAIKSIKIDAPKFDFPKSISVDNFPIQKYPNPVTHISINSLNGSVKTSAVSVTTSATQLPATSLAGRRSIMVYNNDASTTLFLGGADVTTTNGMPVPANSYSPILDAGDELDVYGISTGTINIRVLEIGDEDSGR